jgi:predicted Zn-dependent peptidase
MRHLICLVVAWLIAANCVAEPLGRVLGSSSDAFYQPQVYRLENGLRVILKPRPEVKKVSIRLVVGLGLDSFDCAQSELPHVIEHMLFEGTDLHTNTELEKLVSDYGAHWNASTEEALTIYSFEVYSPYVGFALGTLHEILSRSLLDRPAYSRAIEAAQIESDNADGLKRVWQHLDTGGYGSERLFKDMGVFCDPTIDPYQFTYSELIAAMERYYSIGNMTLVVVGDFATEAVVQQIASGFGVIEAGAIPGVPASNPWRRVQRARYPSRGVLGLSDTAEVGIVWLTGGATGDEYLALRLLGHYLSTRLYNVLRNESQLSYSPAAESYQLPDQGAFYLSADTQRGNEQRVIDSLRAELEDVLSGKSLTAQDFAQVRRSLIIALAMSDLDNAAIADYYSRSLHELGDTEQFWNIERRLQALDYQQFIGSLRIFFQSRPGVEYIDSTVFDTKRLVLFALLCLFLLVTFTAWRVRRRMG